MSNPERPFRTLGWHLKLAREQLKETLAEVSGAVEIDTEILELIEQGRQRPNEDVLFLLISHFGMTDIDANSLWELAGYSDNLLQDTQPFLGTDKAISSNLPMDLRVVYTDLVHVMVNDYGVVINFMQGTNSRHQPLIVSRVGMSKGHARRVLDVLQKTLERADAPAQPKKLLPQVKKSNRAKRKDTTDTN